MTKLDLKKWWVYFRYNGKKGRNNCTWVSVITNLNVNTLNSFICYVSRCSEVRAIPEPPCINNRTLVDLNAECGNHSETGYCRTSNSACLPSAQEQQWRCRCIPGYVSQNETCKQVPTRLFSTSSATFTISQDDTESMMEFMNDVRILNLTGDCSISSTESFFHCQVNDSGAIIKINETLDKLKYFLVLKVSVQIGVEQITVQDNIDVLFIIQRNVIQQTVLLIDGTQEETLVTNVESSTFTGGNTFGVNSNLFRIDSEGLIYTRQTLRLDDLANVTCIAHEINVQVFHSATSMVNLTVIVYRLNFQASVNENTINITIGYLSIQSVPIRIEQSGNYIGINPSNNLIVNNAFDYEQIKSHMFTIHWSVNGQNYSSEITLRVLDQNDNRPSFLQTNYTFQPIRSFFPTTLGIVSANDIDSIGSLQYSMAQGSTSSKVSVHPTTGMLSMIDTTEDDVVTVQVTDGSNSPAFATVVINVRIPIQNDTRHDNIFRCNVTENEPAGTWFCSAHLAGYSSYNFTNREALKHFNLDFQTGNVSTSRPFDREKDAFQSYTITGVKDSESACNIEILGQLVTSVIDENDNAPVFDKTSYKGRVSENAQNKKVNMDHSLRASDVDENPVLTYSITSSQLTINTRTGELTTLKDLDRETSPVISLTVTVSDQKYTNTTTVNIDVQDENDNPPVFTGSPYRFSIPEDASIDTHVGKVIVSDSDAGDNGRLSLSLLDSGGAFQIGDDGVIRVTSVLDRERKSSYTIKCIACDNGSPNKNCAQEQINITVTDINDERPRFNQTIGIIRVMENTTCSNIPNPLFVDHDEGINSELTYKVLRHNDTFIIDSNGRLTCQHLDYEQLSSKILGVEIEATDGGIPKLNATGILYIEVIDANDNSPKFIREYRSGTFSREMVKSNRKEVVTLVDVTDDDSGLNAELKFSGIESSNGSHFLQVDPDNGLIETDSSITMDNGIYVFLVLVTDKGTPTRSSTATVIVDLKTSSVSVTKSFKSNLITQKITENLILTDPLIRLASEINGSDSSLKYGFAAESLKEFYIDEDTGYLYTNQSFTFDRERQSEYKFVVKAETSTYTMLALVTVQILDQNDNPPEFEQTDYVYEVDEENRMKDKEINPQEIKAFDRDLGENAEVFYEISENNECLEGFIMMNETKGFIYLNRTLDYEERRSCKIEITAYNKNNRSMKATTIVHVEVRDINDNTPEFSNSSYHITVKENAKVNVSSSPDIYVRDKESPSSANGDVEVSIMESGCPVKVISRLNESGAVFQVTFEVSSDVQIDFEKKRKYNCTLNASDQGNPTSLSSTAIVNIDIEDVNDNPPVPENVSYTIEVTRDVNVGYVIIERINATDADSGDNAVVNYDFSSADNEYDFFNIDVNTGMVTVKKPLYSLQKDDIVLTVTLFNNGTPQLASQTMLIINITDENVRPFFQSSVYNGSITEEETFEGDILKIQANDIDKKGEIVVCNCTYRLSGNNAFYITTETGIVRMRNNMQIDRELTPVVHLVVSALDSDIHPKEENTTLKIKVGDKNDNDPKFIDTDFSFEIFQKSLIGTKIGTVNATDPDEGENAYIEYSIEERDDTYNTTVVYIDKNSGDLYTNDSLDKDSNQNFPFAIVVKAANRQNLSQEKERSNKVKVVITVQYDDPNKNFPLFSPGGVLSRTVERSAAANTFIIKITANDSDSGDDGKLTYSIHSGNFRDSFEINNETGHLFLKYPLDSSANNFTQFRLRIQARDNGIIPKENFTEVVVIVSGTDVSQTCPQTGPTSASEDPAFQIMTFVFIGLVCVLILTNGFTFYKFRTSKRNNDFDDTNTRIPKAYHKDTFQQQYIGLVKPDNAFTYSGTSAYDMQRRFTDNPANGNDFRNRNVDFHNRMDTTYPQRDYPEEYYNARNNDFSETRPRDPVPPPLPRRTWEPAADYDTDSIIT